MADVVVILGVDRHRAGRDWIASVRRMPMYGIGIFKGLGVTAKATSSNTYLRMTSPAWGKKRYARRRDCPSQEQRTRRGIFTVQYPEEKLPVPEEFRYIPFLVYDEDAKTAAGDPLHLLRHLRQGLPAAVHLDRPLQRPQHRPADPGAGRVLSSTPISA